MARIAQKTTARVGKTDGRVGKIAVPIGKRGRRVISRTRRHLQTLRRIRKDLAERTKPMTQRAPFIRLWKEIIEECCREVAIDPGVRVQHSAIELLQTGLDSFLYKMLSCANQATMFSKRVTGKPQDLKLVLRMLNILLPGESLVDVE
jgi:histone H3/H4